jgi:hypothetical protein
MSAALLDTPAVVVQRAFWPPDLEIDVTQRPRRRTSVVALMMRMQVAVSGRVDLSRPFTIPKYYCTYPDCPRGVEHPFDEAAQLANHRFAAHGIRSTNEESIKRQQRRDRKRALEKGVAPEYIDATHIRSEVKALLPINLQPGTKLGAIDAGDREYVRRRICQAVLSLARELHREPAELTIAIAQVAASGLKPTGLSAKKINAAGALAPAPRSTKRAVARGGQR